MNNTGLECENLSYSVSGLPLLRGISFALTPGKLMLLQGQNGSGKTTLLKLLSGILKAEEGEIRWNGTPIHSIHDYGRQMLYIGHGSANKPALTPREIISFWAKLYGSEELIDAALHYFELNRYAETPSHQLSAGWKQKLALARLIVSPAKLWLLDEPASHLDQEGSQLLQSLISTRKEQGGAILMSMHGDVVAENIEILNINDRNQQIKEEI